MAEPTAQDQYMLELINRARLDPDAEAVRYGIDLNEGLSAGTITSDPKQPLAFNLDLFEAAQEHSQWMLDTDTFSHTGEGGTSSSQRMAAAGYTNAIATAENIAWVGTTGTPNLTTFVRQNHENLFVDEDYPGRGHRVTLMNNTYREIGVSSLEGIFTSDGTDYNAVMTTQDFAASNSNPFLTGVVYDDNLVTDDDFYTVGEGIGGVTVTAVDTTNASNTFTTSTLTAGGYHIELPSGTYNITFSGDLDNDGQSDDSVSDTVTITDQNIKYDIECFLTGTLIATEHGEKAVETLQIGDYVKTADGSLERVKWIGIQTYYRAFATPFRSHPILIKAGALGKGIPKRDLYTSPDHALYLEEGILANAGALMNGVSIIQIEPPAEKFYYYHVELDRHALLLAEGAPAESYLAQGDRLVYDNGEEYAELYPYETARLPMSYPRASSKRQVPRYVKQRLANRAEMLSKQTPVQV
ncbi:MAG: Hint domain-containing protein [Halothece sp. Uz-M2-17]|nr:Hint domain-containing protein [Halothece sp. Uz-M2-17]